MAKISGTAVAFPVVESDDRSTRPTHEAIRGKGGLRTVTSIAQRDAIPMERREAGMIVKVSAGGSIVSYELGQDLVSWTVESIAPGGAGIYPSTTAGLAAVSEGEYFFVPEATGLKLYRDLSGVATPVGDYPLFNQLSSQATAAAASASASAESAETSAEAAALYSDQARAAADATSPTKFYDTKAIADAAIASIAANEVVQVWTDETQGGYRATYRKESGVLVLKTVFQGDAIRTDLASTAAGKGAGLVALEQGGTVQDAVQWVTPEMFGAAADGVSDDSAAMTACVAAAASLGKPIKLGAAAYVFGNVDFSSGIYIEGSGTVSTIIKPAAGADYCLRARANNWGLSKVRFLHDRSFECNAFEIENVLGADAANAFNQHFWVHDVYVSGFLGASFMARNAIRECWVSRLNVRICGDSSRNIAAVHFLNPSTNTEAHNNVIFQNSIVFAPRYIGVLWESEKATDSNPYSRKCRFENNIIHGGTDESNITPYSGSLMEVRGFSDLVVAKNVFTQTAASNYGLRLTNNGGVNSTSASVSQNVFEGVAAHLGVSIDSGSVDVSLSDNRFAANATTHINISAAAARTKVEQQRVGGGGSLVIVDGSTTTQGYLSNDRFRIAQTVNGIRRAQSVTITNPNTTVTVSLAAAEPDANYFVVVTGSYATGSVHVTNKTTTTFDVVVANSPASSGVLYCVVCR